MTSQDDALLLGIVSGDIAPDAPQARALFQRRPELAARLTELRALHGELEREGKLERADIASARSATTERDRQAVRAAFHRRERATPAPLRAGGLMLAAAAALLVGLGVYWLAQSLRDGNLDSGDDQHLGERSQRLERIELSPPGRALAAGVELAWSDTRKPGFVEDGSRWELRFSNANQDPQTAKLCLSIRSFEPRWVLSSADLAPMTERVRWSVVRLSADGKELGRSDSLSLSVER